MNKNFQNFFSAISFSGKTNQRCITRNHYLSWDSAFFTNQTILQISTQRFALFAFKVADSEVAESAVMYIFIYFKVFIHLKEIKKLKESVILFSEAKNDQKLQIDVIR